MASSASRDLNQQLTQEAASIGIGGPHLGILPYQPRSGGLYPQVDLGIWLRSCIHEQNTPLPGIVTGHIPVWLEGDFIQNGPGKFFFGDQVFRHLFDASSLLQKYRVHQGQVFYQCRYLRSKAFEANMAAGSIVTSEFGTNPIMDNSLPNPNSVSEHTKSKSKKILKTLKQRLSTNLNQIMSDNAMISVYPLGLDYFTYYESPFLHRVDLETLQTLSRVDLNRSLGVVSHSSHPHYDENGTMFTIGIRISAFGPEYTVNKFTPSPSAASSMSVRSDHAIDQGSIVARVQARHLLEPSYMHSFAMTDHFFVLIEQPFGINVPAMAKGIIMAKTHIEAMKWHSERSTLFHVIHRSTGKRSKICYKSESFFFLHVINAFEDEGHIVLDISCYNHPDMLYCMYIDALQAAQSNAEYASQFRGRPRRFVLPLEPEKCKKVSFSKATAEMDSKGVVWLKPQIIADLGVETPTIFYEKYNGKKYRFFYGITSDVDDPVCAGQIHKVDVTTGQVVSWYEENVYCAEPIFVPNPETNSEDDGLVISSLIKGEPEVHYTALLVLDAKTMKEMGRAEFRLCSPVPKPLHGYFSANNLFRIRAAAKP